MKRVVIIGAGFSGLHVFYKLRHLISKRIEITVIDQRRFSLLKPSLPEVAFDGAPVSHSLVELQPTIEARGANFIQDSVERIDADANHLELSGGDIIHYDYLFVTLGAVKDYDAIPGYREYGYSVCDDTEAQRLWERMKSFEGGAIVTGAAKSTWGTRVEAPNLVAPCEGPIGEIMFMADYYLTHDRSMERGKDFRLDVFTPGEVFFEDVGDVPHQAVGKVMQERHIALHNNRVLSEIGKNFIAFEDGTRMECDLAIVIPPYAAPEVTRRSKIGDEKGFIPTDEQMRHLDYPNIFAAGDLNALAQPKLGHIAIIQAGIAAATLMNELGEAVEIPPYEPEIFCIMNMGGHEATLILSDVLYGRTTDKAVTSVASRIMKWSFDTYLYYNKGHMPPDMAMDMTDKLIKMI